MLTQSEALASNSNIITSNPAITFTLITSCSSTRSTVPKVRCGELPPNLTMSSALDLWLKMLNSHEHNITPRELYRGMGFITLAKIYERFTPSQVKIVTGGLGLTDLDEKIVAYDFTASPKEPENIHQAVTAEPFIQPIWWKMINERRAKGTAPIRDLVESSTDDYVIIACSKIFLRYIADDVLSIGYEHRDRVRILLAASSQGSVPAQLRPMMIPFDREFIADLPGNRNDNNHRAAFRFLEMLHTLPNFKSLDINGQRQAFMTMSHKSRAPVAHGGGPTAFGRPKIDLEAFLKERPYYLQMPWEEAYKLTRRELGTVGGKMGFRSLLRRLQAKPLTAIGDEERTSAVEALGGMAFLSDPNRQSSTSTTNITASDEESTLQILHVFVEALKTLKSQAIFMAADVCKWSEHYKRSNPQATIPDIFGSPNKLSYILKANSETLGLTEVSVGGGKGYVVATPTALGDAGT